MVTLKVPAVPEINVALFELVIAGAWFTVRVNFCVTVETLLRALMVKDQVPPAVGMPLNVAVPFALLANVTPWGRAPLSVSVATGTAVGAKALRNPPSARPSSLSPREMVPGGRPVPGDFVVTYAFVTVWCAAEGNRP